MTPLKARKKILLLKIEATYGVDPTPTGAANAILVSNLEIMPFDGETIDRDTYQPYLGSRQQIHVGTHVKIGFEVEIAGSGAAGTAPAYGPVLRAAAHAQTINAGVSVVYDPVSSGEESATMYFHHDGHKHAIVGARGALTRLGLTVKQIPKFRFDFMGLYVGPVAAADPTPTLSAFVKPLSVSNDNTPTFSVHSFAAKMASFELNAGSTVIHRELVGEESIQVSDRNSKGSMVIEHPALGTKDFYAIAAAETLAALQIVHGVTAGNIVQLDAPGVQILQPRMSDQDAITMLSAGLNFVPSAAGDDEYSITVK